MAIVDFGSGVAEPVGNSDSLAKASETIQAKFAFNRQTGDIQSGSKTEAGTPTIITDYTTTPSLGDMTIPSFDYGKSPSDTEIMNNWELAGGKLTAVRESELNGLDTGVAGDNKRLHVIRTRASATMDSFRGGSYSADRGKISTLRLLKGPEDDIYQRTEGHGGVDIKEDITALLGQGFVNFFITNSSVTYQEKVQIMTTFGDNEVVYYFGKQPMTFQFQGMLFDSLDADWLSRFVTLYHKVLRGTQLAKNFGLLELILPNMKLVGSITDFTHSQDAARDTDIHMAFTFLAKEMVPLPVALPSGVLSSISGNIVSFAANKTGGTGWGVQSKNWSNLGSGFMETIGSTEKFCGNFKLGSDFQGVSLDSLRSSIFSPVYGIITSITKIVKDTTGDITKIITSFTDPVNTIIRDVTNIASQATTLANLVESSVNQVISIPSRTIANADTAIKSLKNTAGTISRMPENIADIFRRNYSAGRLRHGAAILSSGKSGHRSKTAVLSSGTPYLPSKSYTL